MQTSLYQIRTSVLIIIILGATGSISAHAQWSHDPMTNNPVCTASSVQEKPSMCSDGSGGAIISWVDWRGNDSDIYVQHISAAGTNLWTPNGIVVCAASGWQNEPLICSDGMGGAIVVWIDPRGNDDDIYAQHISSTGTMLWAANGVPICSSTGKQSRHQICSDGSGGIFITWTDERFSNRDVYAQRVNAAGIIQWTVDGLGVCSTPEHQVDPRICSDGSSGAILTWTDARGADEDIYAQHLDGIGAPQWIAGGIPICDASGQQWWPYVCTDGSGGGIIVWRDNRPGTNDWDIYAQRVSGAGSVQWTANGVVVCSAIKNQGISVLLSDGGGGAMMAWQDFRPSSHRDIYAQHIDASGTSLWATNGVAVCTAAEDQREPHLCQDGAGGAIITWKDARSGVSFDLYAQRINSGNAVWATNGVPVCTALNEQNQQEIISDGLGKAIITWKDLRSGTNIYASMVTASGSLFPVEILTFSAILQDEVVLLSWTTATETRNYGFEVQRSSNDKWRTLGFVEGQGTTTEARSYRFTDLLEDFPPNTNLLRYRLKQIDLDGGYVYSPEVEVHLDQPLPQFFLEGFPSPCDDQLTVRLTIRQEGTTNIRLYDVAGRVVMVIAQDAVLAAGSHRMIVRTAEVPSGLYLLVVNNRESKRTEKVVIHH